MEFKNKNPYIILIGGKARSGKSTLANIIGNIFLLVTIIIAYLLFSIGLFFREKN